jgi:hypothetical protein
MSFPFAGGSEAPAISWRKLPGGLPCGPCISTQIWTHTSARQTEANLEAPTFLVSLSFPVPNFTLGSYFFERLNPEYCLSDVNLTVASPLHGESDPRAVFQDTKASLVRMPLASASCRESQPLQPLRVPRLIGSDTIKRHAWGCETDSRRHAKNAWLVHQDIAVFTSSAAP